MFCKKCGKEINENASFCPFCGEEVLSGSVDDKEKSAAAQNVTEKKKHNYTKWIIIAAVILVLIFPVRIMVEKAIVKSVAEQYMQLIKQGPGEDEMDRIVVELLYDATGSKTVTDLIHQHITGQDIDDIYQAIMYHMSYKIIDVKKIESGHYRLTIHIENMDNSKVAAEALREFIGRYSGLGIVDAITQALDDLQYDKSETIAAYLRSASDYLYNTDWDDNYITGDHVVDIVKENGEWTPIFKEGLDAFIFDCAGINYQR